MKIRKLAVPYSFEISPAILKDDRGEFLEWYRFDKLGAAVGHPLRLGQANTSVSRRGVVRGIHYADLPPGQAKYVTVTSGSVVDFIVDIRVGSPTFGTWDSVVLDDVDRRAVYLPEGVGHAFVTLSEEARVSYLVSDVYNPTAEHGIDPLDAGIGLHLPSDLGELILSDKDRDAPTLAEAAAAGVLPRWDECLAYYASLDGGEG